MTNVINNLTSNINSTSLFNSILPIVPFIIIIFGVAFGLNLLRGWVVHNSIINDPDTLGWVDKHGNYHHLRDPEYYD